MTKYGMPPIMVRYTGLFDFDALYAAVIDWCKNHGYIWEEETYKHKVPNPRGAEQEWHWTAEKEVTDYIKYVIDMKPHAWDLQEVVVEKDGKTKTLTSGRVEIVMKGTMTTDWQKRWSKNKFTETLGKIYERMIRREIESVYGDNLYYRMWNLQAVMKKFFDMQTKWHEYKRYLGED